MFGYIFLIFQLILLLSQNDHISVSNSSCFFIQKASLHSWNSVREAKVTTRVLAIPVVPNSRNKEIRTSWTTILQKFFCDPSFDPSSLCLLFNRHELNVFGRRPTYRTGEMRLTRRLRKRRENDFIIHDDRGAVVNAKQISYEITLSRKVLIMEKSSLYFYVVI